MSDKKAKLNIKGEELEFPIDSGTLGNDVIQIKTLSSQNLYTFDPGFATTAMCRSSITYIDGGQGTLLYRGYPIDQLAEKCDYMDVCYLLLHEDLPNEQQKADFVQHIKGSSLVHEQITKFFNGFRRDAHPMAVMVGVIGALSAFYHERWDYHSYEQRLEVAYRLIAKVPTIAAMCYKYFVGEPFVYPSEQHSYAANFLNMMFSVPNMNSEPDPVLSKAMDVIFTLHADHEQNASTTTVRTAGSTGANPFACISAGIGALWGPAHGGANEAALNMLREIGDEANIAKYIAKAKDKNDPFRLMGFGHRVYKNYDPRAKMMQKVCHDVLEHVGAGNDPIFKLAMKLEKIALEDEYFIEKKLYPNVDFYSGITLSAMGIPQNMFTVIFALARTVGWTANWMEMLGDPEARLVRPRQLYVGKNQRDVK